MTTVLYNPVSGPGLNLSLLPVLCKLYAQTQFIFMTNLLSHCGILLIDASSQSTAQKCIMSPVNKLCYDWLSNITTTEENWVTVYFRTTEWRTSCCDVGTGSNPTLMSWTQSTGNIENKIMNLQCFSSVSLVFIFRLLKLLLMAAGFSWSFVTARHH